MEQLNGIIQGSDNWHDLRGKKRTASESVTMMGLNPGYKRDELLEAKATKTPKEYSRFTEEVVFPRGHDNEARTRPHAENIVGADLSAVVGVNGGYIASFDGMTFLEDEIWESKSLNETLRKAMTPGCTGRDLPAMYQVQMEVQLRVCETATKCLFTAAEYNGGDEPTDLRHCWYERNDELWEEIQKWWDQFDADLADWAPKEKRVEAVAETPESFPVPFARLSGELTIEDNLEEFEAEVTAMVQAINTDLVTDQHFADADLRVKQLKEGEDTLESIKKQILAGNVDLNHTIQTIERIQKNLLRKTRLELSPKIEARKKERRQEIVDAGNSAFAAAYTKATNEFAEYRVRLTARCPNFWDVIKGKRSFDNMESAVNDRIAQCKIDLADEAAGFRANLKAYAELATGYEFLFKARLQDLLTMAPDHFSLKIKSEVQEHKDAETKKQEAEKQRHMNTIRDMNDTWALAKEEAGKAEPSISTLIGYRKVFDEIDTSTMGAYEDQAESLKQMALKDINAFIKHGERPVPMEKEPAKDGHMGTTEDKSILEQVDEDWEHGDPLPMTDDLGGEYPCDPSEPFENRGEDAVTGFQGQSSYAQERKAKPTQIRVIVNNMGNTPVFIGLTDENGNKLDSGDWEWETLESGEDAIILTKGDFQ